MNPFQSPTSEPDPVDESVLAVYTRRRDVLVFAFLAWLFAVLWSCGVLRDKGLYSPWTFGILLIAAVACMITWIARRRRPVLAIGAETITFYQPYPLHSGGVTLCKHEIKRVEWGLGYESDILTLRLAESAHGAVYQSNVWRKATPLRCEVRWEVSHDVSLTHERSQIRDTLHSWIRGDTIEACKSQLTVSRIT